MFAIISTRIGAFSAWRFLTVEHFTSLTRLEAELAGRWAFYHFHWRPPCDSA
jgi:hypothetical protein